ncbi:MAG: paraquat-inducible protein [Achromobacter mucicolens]|jgi:paraquat-inducible protein A|uniref:paraquat-inducible protein A n=1 Tax=Achromobacter TaxID=222 RepID=UPI0006FF049F|nr:MULTISPECIES: paraquat-inducible protein A [Achromobacter]KRB12247.1 paraquat-inducible protein A [Achromobacter sp. Root170]MDF2864448.1 paraquat-inducible protein [Achromobacter mucicolens]TQJ97706.1 paraquat-inducible protein A [Achromobacter sp. SLBN-14]UAN04476.1 paraquat-inducible protein A [Achromobacter mucicolens]CAB3817649.1 Intermembrane transport protein PqiA [Achromobacter mucicolens]
MTADRQPLIECEHCASIYRRHQLEPGETANCARCGAVLWRYSGLTLSNWLALAITALIVFGVANAYPVASMSVQGMVQQASLLDAISITWRQGHWVVSIMTGLAGFALPLLQLSVLLWVLGPLSQHREPAGFHGAMRLLGLLRPWCMVPVFLLGVLVAVVKLAGMAAVSPGIGLAAFGILTVLLTMLGRLSPHVLWRYAESVDVVPVHVPEAGPDVVLTGCHVCGQVQALPRDADPEAHHHCVRCDAVVHYRKPDHLARTWALLLAAVVFYIPANVLPVMNVNSLLGDSAHTILGGVVELWQMGSWDIALIVFIASVAVPLTKLMALILLLLTEQWRSTTNLGARTRLYQMVEFIGQWSMLDVFVVILLAALADFKGLMEISAGAGAAAFGVVVILTMLAAMSFDLRRSWDLEDQAEIESAPVEGRHAPASAAGKQAG